MMLRYSKDQSIWENPPKVDQYFTVQPHTILRQHLDYSHWYDRVKLTLKDIHNAQYVACMNPTAGSFTIDARLQGILFSSKHCCNTPAELVRLWVHETQRVYCDKLVNEYDIELFLKVQKDVIIKCFEDCDAAALMKHPLIFSHFATGIGEPKYMPVPDWSSLRKILNEALANYNELNAVMNLVLFEDAMTHVCRINRILEMPQGNALLIGVGGSGKQSLSKLASFISNLEVFQITLRKGYSHADLKGN
ncbi:Hypothetical predicted protein [Octopus vulgaris]|uniref:Dynein heavy chain AAA module D4 domain-containing protein n=1 Tax=Octopus vulgaris TaxID=6645 RepID=A0AA36EV47_OCTVU|nr:Hypothetical predicted protein [Octopus vulgaris]